MQHGFGHGNGNEPTITNISQLNPYTSNNSTIKARVAFKSAIRTYTNAKGEGKLFSVELVDSTGEIKCTFFNETADAFYDTLQVDHVYYIGRGSLKNGNPKFTNTQYEMTLNKGSTVEEVMDTASISDIPKIRYNFLQSIDLVQDVETNTVCDIIGVICESQDVTSLTAKKDGRELMKRSIQIVDQNCRSVEYTMWGDTAISFTGQVGNVIAIKNARVGEYQGAKTLGSASSTQVDFNPDLEVAHQLLEWFNANADSIMSSTHSISSTRGDGGGDAAFGTLDELATLVEQNASGDNKSIYRKIKATLVWIKHDDRAPLFYKAVPGQTHKVVENTIDPSNGKPYYCQKLDKYCDSYEPRYILSMVMADTSCSNFVSVFDDWGKVLLGCPASDVEQMRNNGDEAGLNQVFEQPLWRRFWVKIRASEDNWEGESRIRLTVGNLELIDHQAESIRLLAEIQEMMGA